MYIDFIFFKRQFVSKDNLEHDVKTFLESKLNYKSGYISLNGNNVKCSIDNSNIKKAVPVRIKIDDETESNIEIFSTCKEMIKNNSKEEFYLNISYDGLSRYLANNLYPELADFETKLRSIAYSTLINDLGYDWVNESFSYNDSTKVKLENIERKKEKNKEKEYSKLIRNALEEFYLKDLGTYLFTEYQYPNDDVIVEELLNLAKSGNINQDEIDYIESKIVPKSLIRRYFENEDLNYIKDNFDLINDARNDVMHHKEISLENYEKYKSILRSSLRIIDSLYDEINIGDYKKVEIGEIASAFGNAYRFMNEYNELIDNLRNMINTELSVASIKSIDSIGQSIKPQIPASAFESLTIPMKDHFSNIAQSAFDNNSIIREFGTTQRQIDELARAPKMQDLMKPAFSEIMTQNKMMKAIEDNSKRIMDLNPSFGESFIDDNEEYEEND